MTYPPQPNHYVGAPVQPQNNPQYVMPTPAYRLPTNRSLTKYILLGLVTLGIYPIVIMTTTSEAINTIASRYDGKKTMNYRLLFFLVGWITFGIGWLVWYNNFSTRIGDEQRRRGGAYGHGGHIPAVECAGISDYCGAVHLLLQDAARNE